MNDFSQDGYREPPRHGYSSEPPRPPNGKAESGKSAYSHPALSKATHLATSAEIPACRQVLEQWLQINAPQLDDMRTYEIVLAANELMVNTFEHGDDGGCLFVMRRAGDSLTVTVTNDATNANVQPTKSWAMPNAGDRCGRGLAIVKSVADKVAQHVTSKTISIAATFDLQNITRTQGSREATLTL